ncbi:Trafficking protein particle complex subunit 4 [Diplonema papillatum]|nr:Trafficking protein particle complex subunit 4 [Diplonema papillatum]
MSASKANILSLWIVNKSGGLVYNRDFLGSKALDTNACLKLAGMFHGMHAISKQLSPNPADCSGIEVLEAEGFKFFCFESASGVKLLCSTEPSFHNAKAFLEGVYKVYADVLKDPFYVIDHSGIGQPIRQDRFDRKLDQLIREWNP